MPGRKPLSPEDEARILETLPGFCLRDQALIVMGLNTGFRVTELFSLNVGQVCERGVVRLRVMVARACLKNGRGPRRKSLTSRTVPLNAAASAILEQYLFARFGSGPVDANAPLFPSQRKGMRMSRWRANVIVHLVVRSADIADHEAYGTHSLRKTFARKVYENSGYDINLTRAVLGHREISTTQKYLDVDAGEVDEAILRLAEPTRAWKSRLARRRGAAG